MQSFHDNNCYHVVMFKWWRLRIIIALNKSTALLPPLSRPSNPATYAYCTATFSLILQIGLETRLGSIDLGIYGILHIPRCSNGPVSNIIHGPEEAGYIHSKQGISYQSGYTLYTVSAMLHLQKHHEQRSISQQSQQAWQSGASW